MENLDPEQMYSLEAEAAVLGSIIIDPPCIGKVFEILPTEEAFFRDEHKAIYAALLKLYLYGQPIDAVALRTQLKRANQLDKVGGVEYIAKIMNSVPSSANALYYGGVVRGKRQYRELITVVDQIDKVLHEPLEIDEQVQKMQDLALSIQTGRPDVKAYPAIEYAEKIAASMRKHGEVIKTGFPSLDRIIGGVAPAELIIIAGRPSMGKTSLALCVALRMAQAGKSVVFFTLEMSPESLIEKAACVLGKASLAAIKSDLCSDADLEKADRGAALLKNFDLVVYKGATTPEQQLNYLKRRTKTHKVDVVFIDYLQLMTAGRRTENRVQEVSTISRKLKTFAVQENIPIIALSQLNRQVEQRDKHRPRLCDLRESGTLEQDTDVVMLLHREDYYRQTEGLTEKDGRADIHVAKNRRGPTKMAQLDFIEEQMRFDDPQDPPEPEQEEAALQLVGSGDIPF